MKKLKNKNILAIGIVLCLLLIPVTLKALENTTSTSKLGHNLVELRRNGQNIEWKQIKEADTEWKILTSIENFKGANGQAGVQGDTGNIGLMGDLGPKGPPGDPVYCTCN